MSRFCTKDNRSIEDHPSVLGMRYCELVLVEDKKDEDGNTITVESENEFDAQRTKENNKRYVHESRLKFLIDNYEE